MLTKDKSLFYDFVCLVPNPLGRSQRFVLTQTLPLFVSHLHHDACIFLAFIRTRFFYASLLFKGLVTKSQFKGQTSHETYKTERIHFKFDIWIIESVEFVQLSVDPPTHSVLWIERLKMVCEADVNFFSRIKLKE